MRNSTPILSIGLLENCCHSLKRGYELWNQGNERKDGWLLKEAVIWIHHGIELALKQLLVQSNEYLVFEKIDEAVEKLSRLRRSTTASGNTLGALDLFEEENPAFSVGFNKLIERTAIMLGLSELEKASDLRSKIDALTKYRNKIVHFAVKLNPEEVASLLGEILEPFLQLLEREIENSNFVNVCIPEIREKAAPVQRKLYDYAIRSEDRIFELVKLFNGQVVSGHLFNLTEHTLVLPSSPIVRRGVIGRDRCDIVVVDSSQEWWIEINLRIIYSVSEVSSIITRMQPIDYSPEKNIRKWLVMMSEASPSLLVRLKRLNILESPSILVSSLNEIVELEGILRI